MMYDKKVNICPSLFLFVRTGSRVSRTRRVSRSRAASKASEAQPQ